MWMKSNIITVKFSVLVNVGTIVLFFLQKVLRQGGPLSLCLFYFSYGGAKQDD